MTKLVRRKRRLVLESPLRLRGRALIIHVEAAGLKFREKGLPQLLGNHLGSGVQPRRRNCSRACSAGKAKQGKKARFSLTGVARLASLPT